MWAAIHGLLMWKPKPVRNLNFWPECSSTVSSSMNARISMAAASSDSYCGRGNSPLSGSGLALSHGVLSENSLNSMSRWREKRSWLFMLVSIVRCQRFRKAGRCS
ncbi:hypothetical protein D3C71_1897650 [compost metagenome]